MFVKFCYDAWTFFSLRQDRPLIPKRFYLRQIPLKVQAISAKIIYWKSTHSTSTFWILFKTSHCSSFLQVTLWWNPQAFSRNLMLNLVRMLQAHVTVFSTKRKMCILIEIWQMCNFKFNYLWRGQLVSLNLDKIFLLILYLY